jgi:N6-adenosine-specific RNA methylase IME4
VTELIRYDAACQALAAAVSVDEAREVLSKADAIRVYGRQAKNRKLENDAKIIRWRAIRRLGELMDGKPKAKGGRPAQETGVENTPVKPETLEDQGIDKNLAKLARQYSALDETSFDRLVARCQAHNDGTEKLPLDVLAAEEKAARRKAAQEAFAARIGQGCAVSDLVSHAKAGNRYGAIYADPPWEFKVWSGAGKDRSADNHYRTGGLDEIKALPVADLAADDCALFMWAVMPELPGALDVIKAWGFEYKTCAFTWLKQNKSGEGLFLGMGYWTRANAEVCLLATRGNPERLDAGVPQAMLHPVMEHSRKPDEFHERIQRLVAGPYLEIYARREREGWMTWGNEIPRAKFLPAHDEETGELEPAE